MNKRGKVKITAAVILVVVIAVVAVILFMAMEERKEKTKYKNTETGKIQIKEDEAPSEPLAAVPFADQIPETRAEDEETVLIEEPEPEGRSSYEEGEEKAHYTVTVIGLWDLPDAFAVSARPQLAYYLQLYFYKCLGETHKDDTYTVTILGGTGEESDGIGTVYALCSEYSDIKLKIEYDAYNMTYGISSELGDWSLAALQNIADGKTFVLNEELMNRNTEGNVEEGNMNIRETGE